MKRSFRVSSFLAVSVLTLLVATPAFAQDYYSSDGDAFAALASMGIWAFCCMIPMLLLAVFNIWMLVDAIMRQEYEYPNSTGNSKLIWILLLVFVGLLAAIFYYFMVFKKIKRGSGGGGSAGGYQPPAAPMAPPPMPPQAPPAPPAPPMAPPAPPQQ